MTPVGDFLHHWAPHFVSYGLAILVQSSILILLLLVADVLLRRRVRPAIRYAIWMLALVKLLLPPALASPSSPAYWLSEQLWAAAAPADSATRDAANPLTGVAAVPLIGAAMTDLGGTVTLAERAGRTEPPAQPGYSVSVPVALLAIWMGGVLVLVAGIVRAGRAARRLIATADAGPPSLVALVDDCRRELGVKRPIDIRCTAFAHVPAITGFWNPVILVPAPLLASLTTAQMRAVLLHEVAHCQRGDVWMDCVQTLLQIVHWYNPLVWVANSIIRQVREQAVDEVVLMHMGEAPEVYPETLLHVARMTLRAPPRVHVAGAAILEGGTGLRRRITRMLEGPAPSAVRIGVWNVLLIGAAALIVLPMAPRAAILGLESSCDSASEGGDAYWFAPDLYADHKAQWLACVEARPSDVNVIERAGDFMARIDPALARELYERARALEPQDPRWTSKLIHHRVNSRGADLDVNLSLEVAGRALAQGNPCENLNQSSFAQYYPSLYAKLKEQWLACVESRPEDVDTIERAARFVSRRDPDLARELLERARAIEPLQTRWPAQLARLDESRHLAAEVSLALKLPAEHAIRALKALALAEGERRAAMGRIPEEVQTALPQLAFDAGHVAKARAYAEQLLARSQGEDWIHSWTGAAIHRGNIVLGRIAVREGKLTKAITFLRRSGDRRDLTSSGPNMSLAKDLLEAGETEAVLAYFEQCRRFWKQMPGELAGELLDLWAAEVRQGLVPKFGPSPFY